MSEDDRLAAEAELSGRDADAIEPTERRRRGMRDALARYYQGVLALRGIRRNGAGDGAAAPIEPIRPTRPTDF